MADVRVRFLDEEKDIEEFINKKSSKTGFIKDLLRIEMEREKNYTTCGGTMKFEIKETKAEKPSKPDMDFSDIFK